MFNNPTLITPHTFDDPVKAFALEIIYATDTAPPLAATLGAFVVGSHGSSGPMLPFSGYGA